MKRVLFVCLCLCLFSICSLAQTPETFDIATFQPPKGWSKKASENAIQFSIEGKDSFALITLYKSVPSIGNPKANFDAAWSGIVKEAVPVTAAPQMVPAETKDGWSITAGLAPFEKDGAKGVALLITASGYGKMVNVVILTNSDAYEAATDAFMQSISFKKPLATNESAPVQPTTSASGYAFSTTNFDDGWNAVIKNDWVEVTKGDTTVLLHYGIKIADEMRQDLSNSYWNQISANKYRVKNLYPTYYSVLKDFPYYFVQADATDKATGKNVFVSFQVIPKNGTAYCYEIVTPTRDSFSLQFPTMDKIEALSRYNRFAIGKNDLIGTWQAGGGAFTQYYFVDTGNYAGMNITVSNLKYIFTNGGGYRTDVKAVTNGVYASEKEIGRYTVANWDVSTTDQKGKVSAFSAWFEATKGGRILHLLNKKHAGEHYQLGKER